MVKIPTRELVFRVMVRRRPRATDDRDASDLLAVRGSRKARDEGWLIEEIWDGETWLPGCRDKKRYAGRATSGATRRGL